MSNYQPFTNARYDSIVSFLSAIDLPCRVSGNKNYWNRFMVDIGHGGDDWYGANCNNGHAVQKLMRDGWNEGRERLNELRSKIATVDVQPIDKRRRMVRGAAGDNLDMPYVWSGRLDIAWRTPRRTSATGPTRIELVANMICSGGEHSDVLFWRGAAAVVLADILEAAGYMVRLVVNFGGMAHGIKGGEKCSCRITVKEHGMPLDITSTSAVILPGFFRALGHAWIANHAPYQRDQGGIMVGEGIVDDNEVLVTHRVRDHATALAFVNESIARANENKLGVAA